MKTTRLISAALAAAMLTFGGSAWAADCGLKPQAPNIPDDGAKASGKDMENASKDLETYSNAFAAFNDCIIKEYNETLEKWKVSLAAYQAKNK